MKGVYLILALILLISCEKEIQKMINSTIRERNTSKIENNLPEPDHIYKIQNIYGDKIPEKESMNGDITRYEDEKYVFYFGYGENWEHLMLVKDKKGNKICTHTSVSDSQIFNPTFYKTEFPGDPMIILIEGAGCGESWGNSVLIENDGCFKKIGYINVATRYTPDNYELADNIAPFTEIRIDEGRINFRFTIADIVYHPPGGEPYQQKLNGEDLSYSYVNGNFILNRK